MSKEAFVKAFQSKLATHLHFTHGFQSWWHKYIFHFSDISNIIKILDSGKLYSRNNAIELGLMSNDNADDQVISKTGRSSKHYVRFYFGAKTPTQFINEGFKSRNSIVNNAHCPFPIFLLFDFVKLLSRDDCLFSDGNIASTIHTTIYQDITALNNLEFEYIYHRAPLLDPETKAHIKNCRHAEVLIPDEINVYEYLSKISVRSEAEKQTLLYCLSSETRDMLKDDIHIRTIGLFYADRLYVDKVSLENDIFKIQFSKPTQERYDITFILTNIDTGFEGRHDASGITLESRRGQIRLHENFIGHTIELQININDNLAYKNSFTPSIGLIL
jgi:hypothetical protein